VRINQGELQVQQGQAMKPDAIFYMDMPTYLGMFSGQLRPDDALAAGLIRIEGDPDSLERFLGACGLPGLR
jgi:putative sterol carrier protein